VRILQILYYYEPYTSGLTIYAARLAKELAARGHDVSVLSSRHDRSLPREETTPEGIQIRRLPVAASLDRAVIVPTLIPTAIAMMRTVDVVHLHLPLAEAAVLVALGRPMGKRVIVTHHADLVLEGSFLSRVAATAARWSAVGGGKLANVFVTNTASRARVSPVAKYMHRNLRIIPPPIVVESVSGSAGDDFRRDFTLGAPVVGYVGRYASEKGIDVLLQTIPNVRKRFPNVTFALAGSRFDPRDGSELRGPWTSWLETYVESIRQLDYLSDADLARFYAACDVLVLPSVDWTESFGMVQIEAMLRGTPVVASDLPGVADPVTKTGYGLLARPGDVSDLAAKITQVLDHPDRYRPDPQAVSRYYSLGATADAYERVYRGEPEPRS